MSLSTKFREQTGRRYLLAALGALAGMIIGALVGIGVQVGVESTGILGPSVEALMAEQEQNFNEVYGKLDRLAAMTDDPDVLREIERIREQIQIQEELAERADAEMRHASEQLIVIKDQAMRDTGIGVSGVADFWLKNGEGVNVGNGAEVFGLSVAGGNYADVTLSGSNHRMNVGDRIGFENDDMKCVVLVKQLVQRADGRIGFDFDCDYSE